MTSTKLQKQRGMVLVTSLLFLMLITLLSLSAVGTSVLEERMAANARDKTLAFEAAEYALLEAREMLSNAASLDFSETGGVTGAYYINLNSSPNGEREIEYWRNVHDWEAHSIETSNSNAVLPGQRLPRYVVEKYTPVSCGSTSRKWPTPDSLRNSFRITVRGYGQSSGSVVFLQSWYDEGCS